MMKNIIKSALMSVVGILAVSCSSEEEMLNNTVSNGKIEVSIEGVIDGYTLQEETRADAQSVIRIMWGGGETVYAYEGTTLLGTLEAQTAGPTTKLSGSITAPAEGNVVTLVYSPQFSSTPVIQDGKIKLDLSTQNEEKLPFMLYGVLPTVASGDISNAVVNFKPATSMFRCNCTGLEAGGTFTEGIVDQVNTTCTLALSTTGEPTIGGENLGEISRTADLFTTSDGLRAVFSVAVPKSETNSDRMIGIIKDAKLYYSEFSDAALNAAKSYNSVFALKAANGSAEAKAYVGDPWQENWVALWKDGPKFAIHNLNDAKPRELYTYGLYYQVQGTFFSDDFIDNATQRWGENWQTPAIEDFEGLLGNCTYETVEKGIKFTGKGIFSYNSIWLPASGVKSNIGAEAMYKDMVGYYHARNSYFEFVIDIDYIGDSKIRKTNPYIWKQYEQDESYNPVRPVLKENK